MKKNILIIKFGGLGDFFISLLAMEAIRKNFFGENLYLLTELSCKSIALKSNWFNKVIIIKRSLFYIFDKMKIINNICLDEIDLVIDLQTSRRTNSYYSIFKHKSNWNGIASGCKFFHANPERNKLHTYERQKDQLKLNGIEPTKKPDLNWLFNSKNTLGIKKRYVFIVPGGSRKRKNKRIPKLFFLEIIKLILKKNYLPILIGGKDEVTLCQEIKKVFPEVKNLCNKLDLLELASLSNKVEFIIGNDTGPMHLFGLNDSNMIVLFTKYSDPKLCAPVGKNTKIIEYNRSNKNLLDNVFKTIKSFNLQFS